MADGTLKYNVRWIEHTFTSRTLTESLLSPERESGNISQHDYEAATNFLPGFHRHYRLIGGTLAFPLAYPLRRPTWSNARTYMLLTSASLAGFVVGHVMSLSAHFNFVRSIENPSGFSQAMENIQRNMGGPTPPGPVIIRQKGKWTMEHGSESPSLDTSDPKAAAATHPSGSPPSPSKWDQIRATNTRMSNNSSWDTLRQNHERVRVAGSGSPSDDSRPRDDDRAAEQASFDALLEKERNMK